LLASKAMLSVRKLIESSYYCMNNIMILIYNLGTFCSREYIKHFIKKEER